MCLYVPENIPKSEFLSHFYKSMILCFADQLTVELIRNCDMPFFAETSYLQGLFFGVLWNMYSLDVY